MELPAETSDRHIGAHRSIPGRVNSNKPEVQAESSYMTAMNSLTVSLLFFAPITTLVSL